MASTTMEMEEADISVDLSRIPSADLKKIKVSVRRHNMPFLASMKPIERSIEDHELVTQLVHAKAESFKKPIFDRLGNCWDNKVHKRYLLRELPRLVDTSQTPPHSTSSGRSPPRNKSRDKSPMEKTRKARDSSKRNSRSTSRGRYDDQRSNRSDKEGDRSERRSRSRTRNVKGERWSRSPHRSSEKRKETEFIERGTDRHRKYSRSRSQSKEKYKHVRKSLSPRYRKSSQRSPSFDRSSSSTHRREDPSKKHSDYSEYKRRRSKSPNSSSRAYYKYVSESSRRHSRSPSRYEKLKRKSRSPARSPHSKYRRLSRSPGSYRRKSRSRSPHPPVVTFSRKNLSESRRSRSPTHRDKHYRDGSKSSTYSPTRRHQTSYKEEEHAMEEYPYYEGIPGPEYWAGAPMRPGFPMPRFFPPPFYPRPVPPMMMGPRMPMMYPPYRFRMPFTSRPSLRTPAPSQKVSMVSKVSESDTGSLNSEQTDSKKAEDTVTIEDVTENESTDKKET